MIKPSEFYDALSGKGLTFFTGVPDSLLKHFLSYMSSASKEDSHIIAANEGNAIGIATGRYLATKLPAVVYLQNSGLGNTVNPLLSLTNSMVYSIPMLLLIGWRGEDGKGDEPQHIAQGRVTPSMLELLSVPTFELNAESDFQDVVGRAATEMARGEHPVAILVRKNAFASEGENKEIQPETEGTLTREGALREIVGMLDETDVLVSSTGMVSRELFELRESLGQSHGSDFLCVGSMGHASSIALGVSSATANRRVVCIDGDGSALMHLGAMGIIPHQGLAQFLHILLNNGAHDSVGGQPTVGNRIDFLGIASSVDYGSVVSAVTKTEIRESLSALRGSRGINFLEIKIRKGFRQELGRPTNSPMENRKQFMKNLHDGA